MAMELTARELILLAKHHHEEASRAVAVRDYDKARYHTGRANEFTHAAIEAERRAMEKQTDAGT
jgi:hypothetical protein